MGRNLASHEPITAYVLSSRWLPASLLLLVSIYGGVRWARWHIPRRAAVPCAALFQVEGAVARAAAYCLDGWTLRRAVEDAEPRCGRWGGGPGEGLSAAARVGARYRVVATDAGCVLRNERASAPLLELLGARLDLNGATAAELQSIPGIGPLLAGRLVAHRNAHGPFRSAEQLRAVAGVGPSMLHRLSRWVTLGKEAAPGASP